MAASAEATSTAPLALWPSQWPGAPSTMARGSATPEAWELSGLASYSVWIAITGVPLPQVAQKPLAKPEMPRVTWKPAVSRRSHIRPEVSISCMPNSAK